MRRKVMKSLFFRNNLLLVNYLWPVIDLGVLKDLETEQFCFEWVPCVMSTAHDIWGGSKTIRLNFECSQIFGTT